MDIPVAFFYTREEMGLRVCRYAPKAKNDLRLSPFRWLTGSVSLLLLVPLVAS